MSNTKNIVKQALKNIRTSRPVNALVRYFIKNQIGLATKVFNLFSMHWPINGTIKFRMPQGENAKLYSRSDDYIAQQVFWKGFKGYEGPSVDAFYYLSKKSSVTMDIGANTGYFTVIAASSNIKSTVHSFEPVKRIYDRLCKNIEINCLTNVNAVNSLVGDSENPVKFYLPKGDDMVMAGSTKKEWAKLHDVYGADNSLLARKVNEENEEEIEVPSITLDKYKKNQGISKIDLIKMDCECHEIEVLNGMSKILKEDKPVILMEVVFENEWLKDNLEMATHTKIESIMKDNGYYFYMIFDNTLIRVDKLEYNPNERNYIFSPYRSEKVYLPFSEISMLLN